jgi:hypothetical protein
VSRRAATAVRALCALAALAAPAAACPYCSLSQGADTLAFIAAFLVVPYAVVAGTLLCIRRILRSERGGPT